MRQATIGKADAMIFADEAALIARAQVDRLAFAPLYDRYVDGIYRFALRRTGQHAAAQDVTSETFRRALERLNAYEWRGRPFGAWLFQIAANVLREQRRALTYAALSPPSDDEPDQPELAALADGDPPPDELLSQREETHVLWRLVEEMPLQAQRILLFRYAWDLSYTDIAARLGRTEAACKQLAYRALKDLRQRALAAGYWNDGEQAEGSLSHES